MYYFSKNFILFSKNYNILIRFSDNTAYCFFEKGKPKTKCQKILGKNILFWRQANIAPNRIKNPAASNGVSNIHANLAIFLIARGNKAGKPASTPLSPHSQVGCTQ